MGKIVTTIREIHHMDDLAERDQWVNEIHPLVKFVVTIFYLVCVASLKKYDLIRLIGLGFYLVILFGMADLSLKECFRKIRLIIPVIFLIGAVNPIFDRTLVCIGEIQFRAGWISMGTLFLKGMFCVTACYLLIATTGMEKICYALQMLHMPKVLIVQFLLTYRYITLLLGEVDRMSDAYALRAPKQKGIHFKVWGSFVGQLLLRSMDRAEKVYESMCVRGYSGDFRYLKETVKWKGADLLYLIIWGIVIWILKCYPIIMIIGNLIT